MTDRSLTDKRVVLLIEQEFDDREVTDSVAALGQAGVRVIVAGPVAGATYYGKSGTAVVADVSAASVRLADVDGIVVPGGHAPDRMRLRHAMVDLVAAAVAAGKPVAAICHGPQLLISANVVRGRTLTCWPSIAIDVKNAGGRYVDKPVVIDGSVITSRKPDDVPHFTSALLHALTGSEEPGAERKEQD